MFPKLFVTKYMLEFSETCSQNHKNVQTSLLLPNLMTTTQKNLKNTLIIVKSIHSGI